MKTKSEPKCEKCGRDMHREHGFRIEIEKGHRVPVSGNASVCKRCHAGLVPDDNLNAQINGLDM